MDLAEIRKEIDRIDPQIRELIMRRMDQSKLVAESKIESGDTTIFRPDREADIYRRLSEGVPEIRLAEYISVVRHIMESSRMYQYDLMYDMLAAKGETPAVKGAELLKATEGKAVRVRVKFARPDVPNSLASILGMIGDYGCNMKDLKVLDTKDNATAFEAVFVADVPALKLNKLVFQLSKESSDFEIVECSAAN